MVSALLSDVPAERGGGPENIFYWENLEGGHGGAADNKQSSFMWALSYNFMWQALTGEGPEADRLNYETSQVPIGR